MSKKIDVSEIIRKHYQSMVYTDGQTNYIDWFVFVVLPLLCALLFPLRNWELGSGVLSIFVNLGAIFTALLISVLVMIFDQFQKTKEKLNSLPENHDQAAKRGIELRIEVMGELFANISYAVVISVLLVFSALAYELLGSGHCVSKWLFMPLAVFIAANLLLTVLMVIKRTFILVSHAD